MKRFILVFVLSFSLIATGAMAFHLMDSASGVAVSGPLPEAELDLVNLAKEAGGSTAKIVREANKCLKEFSTSGSFPYAPGTQNGNLGCANVVTHVLKKAGEMDAINLGCVPTVEILKKKGWREVTPPPYKAGDVITWATYIKGTDSHIGIVMQNGGSNVKVMNNSSSQRKPVLSPANSMDFFRLLRKC